MMENQQFKLQPGDVLVKINENKDPFAYIKRWVLDCPYDHVYMYMGKVGILLARKYQRIIRIPMLFESDGDGVVIESLSSRYGEKVVVMRLKSINYRKRIPYVLTEAIKLAEDPQSKYDYQCIMKYVLPELLCRKIDAVLPGDLVVPRPTKWQRDILQMCSEAVFEAYYRAKFFNILFSYCTPPLPSDFVFNTPLLEQVAVIILSEEVVSNVLPTY